MSLDSQNFNKIIEMINGSFEESYKSIFEELEHILEEDVPLSKLQLNDNNISSVFSQILPKLWSNSDISTHLSFLSCYFRFIEKCEINEEICLSVTNYIRNVINKWSILSTGVESSLLKQYFQV